MRYVLPMGLLAASFVMPELVASLASAVAMLSFALLGFMIMLGSRQERVDRVSSVFVGAIAISIAAWWVRPVVTTLTTFPAVKALLLVGAAVGAASVALPLLGRLLEQRENPRTEQPRRGPARRARMVRGLRQARPTSSPDRPRRRDDDDLGLLG